MEFLFRIKHVRKIAAGAEGSRCRDPSAAFSVGGTDGVNGSNDGLAVPVHQDGHPGAVCFIMRGHQIIHAGLCVNDDPCHVDDALVVDLHKTLLCHARTSFPGQDSLLPVTQENVFCRSQT